VISASSTSPRKPRAPRRRGHRLVLALLAGASLLVGSLASLGPAGGTLVSVAHAQSAQKAHAKKAKPAKDSGKKPAKGAGKKPGKEAGKKPAKDSERKPAKDAGNASHKVPKKHPDPSSAQAQPAKPAATPTRTGAASAPEEALTLKLTIERATLENGLRVVLNPDKTSPTVAVAVTYDVGSRDEQRGRSGFAHLFEHMMFQGSRNVPRGDHFKLVSGHGGVLNGTTSSDRTNYFEVLPANELALTLWLEADRMKALDVSEANFENQRKVVQEEYRMRVSNAPYVPAAIRLEELVYQGYFPYEHSTIGSMQDLDDAKIEWVQEFHARHYAPNNAVLSIAGDFEPSEAMALVEKYFGPAKKTERAPYQDPPFPEQTSQRTAVIKDDNVLTPGVRYGWAIPPYRSADHYALELAAIVLGGGESSRLYQLLVRDKALVQDISVSTDDRRGPDLFSIDAILAKGAKMGEVEKLIETQLKGFAPTDAELSKAKRRVESSFVLGLQSNMARARTLGEFEIFFGDARLINDELPLYLAVTKDDVKRVAAQHLSPTRRTIVETYPSRPPAEAETPPTAERAQHAKRAANDGAATHKGAKGHATKKAPSKPKKGKK
jgi:zinc protease